MITALWRQQYVMQQLHISMDITLVPELFSILLCPTRNRAHSTWNFSQNSHLSNSKMSIFSHYIHSGWLHIVWIVKEKLRYSNTGWKMALRQWLVFICGHRKPTRKSVRINHSKLLSLKLYGRGASCSCHTQFCHTESTEYRVVVGCTDVAPPAVFFGMPMWT